MVKLMVFLLSKQKVFVLIKSFTPGQSNHTACYKALKSSALGLKTTNTLLELFLLNPYKL